MVYLSKNSMVDLYHGEVAVSHNQMVFFFKPMIFIKLAFLKGFVHIEIKILDLTESERVFEDLREWILIISSAFSSEQIALPMMVGIPKKCLDDHSPPCLDHGINIRLDIVHDTGIYSETWWDSLGLNGARVRFGGCILGFTIEGCHDKMGKRGGATLDYQKLIGLESPLLIVKSHQKPLRSHQSSMRSH